MEQYGAQPPIELLRQAIDTHAAGGWYGRKDLVLRRLQGLQFIAAMGPPGGGCNNVTQRYLRHFSVITCVQALLACCARLLAVAVCARLPHNRFC